MAGESPHYSQWTRQQVCAACGGPGPCEPHHALYGTTYSPEDPRPAKAIEGARKGKAQRAHDYFLIPLHSKCHAQFHAGRGWAEGKSPAQRDSWEQQQVTDHRARYAREFPRGEPEPKAKAVRPPATAGDAVTRAWLAGSSAERSRIVSWLEETAARTGLHSEAHAALMESAEVLRNAEPTARPR